MSLKSKDSCAVGMDGSGGCAGHTGQVLVGWVEAGCVMPGRNVVCVECGLGKWSQLESQAAGHGCIGLPWLC